MTTEDEMSIEIRIDNVLCDFDHDRLTPQEIRDAVGAGEDFEVWQVIYNPALRSEILFDEVQITSPITIKNGDRFRLQARATA